MLAAPQLHVGWGDHQVWLCTALGGAPWCCPGRAHARRLDVRSRPVQAKCKRHSKGPKVIPKGQSQRRRLFSGSTLRLRRALEALRRNKWDVLTGNSAPGEPYYDLWALRSSALGVEDDCWRRDGAPRGDNCDALEVRINVSARAGSEVTDLLGLQWWCRTSASRLPTRASLRCPTNRRAGRLRRLRVQRACRVPA